MAYRHDAIVADRDVAPLLTSALDDLEGEAVAVGALVDDHLDIARPGSIAGVPVRDSTVFYAASGTKQFVGVAAAQAVLDGVLSIDDPVSPLATRASCADGDDPAGPPRPPHLRPSRPGRPRPSAFRAATQTRGGALPPGRRAGRQTRFTVRLQQRRLRPPRRGARRGAGDQPIDQLLSAARTTAGRCATTRFGGAAISSTTSPDPPVTVGDGGLWTSVLRPDPAAAGVQPVGSSAPRPSGSARRTTTLTDGSPVSYAWGVRVTPHAAGRLITHGGSWHAWLAKTVRIPEQHVAVAILSLGSSELDVSRTGIDLADAIASH